MGLIAFLFIVFLVIILIVLDNIKYKKVLNNLKQEVNLLDKQTDNLLNLLKRGK